VPLALALLAGILVAWTPRYWREAVPIAAISMVALIWALTARRVELPRLTILVVLIGILGPIQLALHLSRVPWPTTQRSIEWAMSAVCFVLGSQILQGRRNTNPFLSVLLWTMTALAVEAMLQFYLTPGRVFGIIPVGDNVVGTLYYKNQFAAMMELAAPLALWRVYNGKVVSGGLCFAAMFAATITSESRMGVVLILVELLVFLIVMVVSRRMPANSFMAVVAALALLVTGATLVAGTEAIWIRLREPDAYALRRNLLNSTLKMIPAHPWQGSGLGTWPNEYPGFATYDTGVYVNEAHNDWAQWASEGGIPFLLLMAALTILLVRPSFQSVWGLGLLSVMIHSYVDYPLRDPSLAFLWFTLAGALTRIEAHRSRRESTA
jgi:O-antigen ligase